MNTRIVNTSQYLTITCWHLCRRPCDHFLKRAIYLYIHLSALHHPKQWFPFRYVNKLMSVQFTCVNTHLYWPKSHILSETFYYTLYWSNTLTTLCGFLRILFHHDDQRSSYTMFCIFLFQQLHWRHVLVSCGNSY